MDGCERQKEDLVKELTASKMVTFERDGEDYQTNFVYGWKNLKPRGRPGRLHNNKHVQCEAGSGGGGYRSSHGLQQAATSATDLDYDTPSTTSSQLSGSFLDRGIQRDKLQPNTRNADGGIAPQRRRGRPCLTREPYPIRQKRTSRY